MGNKLIFPANSSTYRADDIDGLFWVPAALGQVGLKAPPIESIQSKYYTSAGTSKPDAKRLDQRNGDWIPCQYFASSTLAGKRHLLIYFHGNSCDLGDMVDEMKAIQESTGRHVLHFEYPGYGVCQSRGTIPDADLIDHWGRAVSTFAIACGMPPETIVPIGRSIGTGPAAKLARYLNDLYGSVGGLILHSPYVSIHAIIQDYGWKISTFFFPNYWDIECELKKMEGSSVPLLIIHGQKDEVIPVRHGRRLYEGYDAPNSRLKFGFFPEQSEHNCYDVREDVIYPIREFLSQVVSLERAAPPSHIIPTWCHKIPKNLDSSTPKMNGLSQELTRRPIAQDSRPIQSESHARSHGGADNAFCLNTFFGTGLGGGGYRLQNQRATALPSGGLLSRILLCDCSSPSFQTSPDLIPVDDEGFRSSSLASSFEVDHMRAGESTRLTKFVRLKE